MTVISPPIQALLELFDTALSDVRFADLDAAALSALAGQVTAAAQGVAAKQAALEEANATLLERQNALLQQAQRALAYARVYAENDFELRAKLEAIALPRAPRRPRAETSSSSAEPERAAPAEPKSGAPAEEGSVDEPLEARANASLPSRKKKRESAQSTTA
ncbi:MAG TPA: hypothetical protein VG937_18695 [Polyangiaceae bacterium]|nr:hypothetical protein [Polyangiaceae bacterium]